MSGQVEDFDEGEAGEFDDFETVAEKPKKIIRAFTKPETTPKGGAGLLERNRSRKDSDMDTEIITRNQRKTSDVVENVQPATESPSAKVEAAEPVKEEKVEKEKVVKEEPK